MDVRVRAPAKPLLRGVSHQVAFFVSLVAAPFLIATARGALGHASTAIYSASLSSMLGTSALYHRRNWAPAGRRRMKRLDHSMIFLLIAGTYTPIGFLALHGGWRASILAVVWTGALAGIAMRLFWLDAPTGAVAAPYVVVGWVAVTALAPIAHALGAAGLALLLTGGVLYSLGALAYAFKAPDPFPRVFGYHEIFHALVIAAAVCHWLVVRMAVIRAR